jgi:hypothetical protein
MTYEIRAAKLPPSTPYERLQDAVQAAREYSDVWERDLRLTYRIYDASTGAVVATVAPKSMHVEKFMRLVKRLRALVFPLILALTTAFAGGELFLRSDYNQQHVLGAYPPGVSNMNDIPRQHMGVLDWTPTEKTRTRVLIIGDSYTWGGAVHPSQRFADVLAREHPEIEVVVIAPQGANTAMEFDLWKEYGRDVKADIVVLAVSIGDNDMGLYPVPTPPKEYTRLLLPESQLAAFLDDHLTTAPDWTPYYDFINTNMQSLARWVRLLAAFSEDVRAHRGIPYAITLAQPLERPDARAIYERMTAGLALGGWQAANFQGAYEAYYGEWRVNKARWAAPNDPHYNAETHALLAGFIWKMLQPELR